jgi:hypothetical protein
VVFQTSFPIFRAWAPGVVSVVSSKEKEPTVHIGYEVDGSKHRSGPLKRRKESWPQSGTEPRFLGRPARRRHYSDRIMSDSPHYLLILCLKIQVF